MENRKAIILATICFLIAILLISAYVRVRESEMTIDFGERVKVVVAVPRPEHRGVIPEYTILTADMVAERTDVFKKFRQPAAVSDVNDVIGKATYVPLYDGEQITLTKLITQDGKPLLDRQVEKEKRALTLSISPHTGVGRLVRPGDRVDILTAPHYEMDSVMTFEVTTVLQGVLVLATGKHMQNEAPSRVTRPIMDYLEEQFEMQKRRDWGAGNRDERLATSRPADDYTTFTIQVSPEEAKKLLYLTATYGPNRLYFTLRNNADQSTEKLQTTLLDDVLGPDSDYGRSFRKPVIITPPPPRFYDYVGGQPQGVP